MNSTLRSFFHRHLFTLLAVAGVGAYVLVAGTTGSCPACAAVTGALGLSSSSCATGLASSTVQATPKWSLQTLDGEPLTSEGLRGKVVLVDFWATWCPPCRKEVPGLAELSATYGPEGLVVVGISLDEDGPETVRAFAQAQGIPYDLAMADPAVLSAFGGVRATPTAFLLDREGTVVFEHTGFAGKDRLERAVRDNL